MPHLTSSQDLLARARTGDMDAIDRLLALARDDVLNLAVRMLWHPEDAEDATQEILFKVASNLGTFRGESAFGTWVHRISINHLLNVRRSRVEREDLTFERFGAQLAVGLDDLPAPAASDPDQALLEEEVKIGCTQGMLLCLDREDRVAYVLGDVFGLQSEEAAEVLQVTAPAFRKRLSRARERLRAFMRGHCGLVNSEAACHCRRRVGPAVRSGRVVPGRLLFASNGSPSGTPLPILEQVDEMDELHEIAAIFRSHPRYAPRGRLVGAVRSLLATARHSLLRDGDEPPGRHSHRLSMGLDA